MSIDSRVCEPASPDSEPPWSPDVLLVSAAAAEIDAVRIELQRTEPAIRAYAGLKAPAAMERR